MNDPIDSAKTLGSSDASVQVWFLILLGIAAVIWAVKALRGDSAELRKDLKEQSRMREELLAQLIKCVDSNTAVLKDNREVLEGAKYQLKRSQETLERFIT